MGVGIYKKYDRAFVVIVRKFSVSNKNLLPCCYNPHFPIFGSSVQSSSTRNEQMSSACLRGIWLPLPESDNPSSSCTNILKRVLLNIAQ